jgi:hypothetical protein
LPLDVSKSSTANNFGEGFEHGPHFYRLTDKIVKPGEPALSEGRFIFDVFGRLAAAAAANLRNVQLESRIPVSSLTI